MEIANGHFSIDYAMKKIGQIRIKMNEVETKINHLTEPSLHSRQSRLLDIRQEAVIVRQHLQSLINEIEAPLGLYQYNTKV